MLNAGALAKVHLASRFSSTGCLSNRPKELEARFVRGVLTEKASFCHPNFEASVKISLPNYGFLLAMSRLDLETADVGGS